MVGLVKSGQEGQRRVLGWAAQEWARGSMKDQQ